MTTFARISASLVVAALVLGPGPTRGASAFGPTPLLDMTAAQYAAAFKQTAADLRSSYKSFNAALGGNLMPSTCTLWNGNQANKAQRDKIYELRAKLQKLHDDEKRKGKDANQLNVVLAYARLVMATEVDGGRVGNCGEMSSVAFAMLYMAHPELEFMLVGFKDKDHQFVLSRLPNGDVYVIDAWRGTSGGAFLYSGKKLFVKGTTTNSPDWPGELIDVTGWESSKPAPPP